MDGGWHLGPLVKVCFFNFPLNNGVHSHFTMVSVSSLYFSVNYTLSVSVTICKGKSRNSKPHKTGILLRYRCLPFEGLLIHMVVIIHIHDKWCTYTNVLCYIKFSILLELIFLNLYSITFIFLSIL